MADTAPQNTPAVKEEFDEKTIIEYLDAFGYTNELTDQEKRQVIQIETSFQLTPFKKEIYCVPYGSGQYRSLSILVGYEVYLKRAERTGLLDGWRAWIDGTGEDGKAVVEIWRKDWSKPFIHEVFWKEAAQVPAQKGCHQPGLPHVLSRRARRHGLRPGRASRGYERHTGAHGKLLK